VDFSTSAVMNVS